MTDYLPESLMYATAEISEVSRNRFRLETVSSDKAGPGRIVTFNLPENALIDSKSLRFYFDAKCTGVVDGTDTIYAKLPTYASTLIQKLEIYINGVQVQQGAAEFNTIAQVLREGQSCLDKNNSIDRVLAHSYLESQTEDGDESETICMSEFCGFLSEGSTRYLNTSMLGQIQIRLTFAGNEVIQPRQMGEDYNTALTGSAKTNAEKVKYEVDNMYFTTDSISLSDMYNAMLRKRLETGGLKLNFKEYYSFQMDGISSSNANHRFSLSSGCIDRLYATFRDSGYNAVGQPATQSPDALMTETFKPNFLTFKAFADGDGKIVGPNTRYQFSINNVRYPQYQASWLDGLADVSYAQDKVGKGDGTLITSKKAYTETDFIYPLLMSLPCGKGVSVKSGFNSRGINTQMVFEGSRLELGASTSVQSFIVAETTATMSINMGRDIAVMW